jgi:hypothetical protein
MRPRLVPFRDGCKYGGFGKSKGYELMHTGKIKGSKMGKRTMLDLESIDRYHASLPKITPDGSPTSPPARG